jgi:hypothetical protein
LYLKTVTTALNSAALQLEHIWQRSEGATNLTNLLARCHTRTQLAAEGAFQRVQMFESTDGPKTVAIHTSAPATNP